MVIKKSRSVLTRAAIGTLSGKLASENPAKNPPMAIGKPMSDELTNPESKNTQAKLKRKRLSKDRETTPKIFGKMVLPKIIRTAKIRKPLKKAIDKLEKKFSDMPIADEETLDISIKTKIAQRS